MLKLGSVLPIYFFLFIIFSLDCFEANTDFEDYDLVTSYDGTLVERISKCQEDCKNQEGCKFFTYKDNTCYLKTSDAGRRFKNGAISGVAPCESTSGFY